MKNKKYFAHITAIIDKVCKIEAATRIWHRCHIMKGVKIGRNCNIGENAFIETGVIIGNNVKIKNNVAIYTGVICEDNVFLGPNCVFTNVSNPRSFIERKKEFKQTIINQGATIGANATIVCGNNIGKYAFIGAGSVVTKPVPDYTMVIGNPAKFYAYVCKCGCKLNIDYKCNECGNQYKKDEDGKIVPVFEK